MVQSQSVQRRPWALMSGIGAVILGILVAFVTGHMVVLFGALVVAGLATALWAQPYAAQREQLDQVRAAALEPVRQHTIATADGTLRAAIALDLPADEGYTTVLTRDGYALVNREGQIVYTLKR
ncbi:MAG TPA: hypothetical protein VFT66_21335 [Roseiflexaceae bacterium]|nr:hypothetical protein [Roseiflexaceae bacterium]